MWLCFPFFSFYVGFLCIHLWWPLLLYVGEIFCSWFSLCCHQKAGLMFSLDFARLQCPVIHLTGISSERMFPPRWGAFSIAWKHWDLHLPLSIGKKLWESPVSQPRNETWVCGEPTRWPARQGSDVQMGCQILMELGNTEATKCCPGSTGGI